MLAWIYRSFITSRSIYGLLNVGSAIHWIQQFVECRWVLYLPLPTSYNAFNSANKKQKTTNHFHIFIANFMRRKVNFLRQHKPIEVWQVIIFYCRRNVIFACTHIQAHVEGNDTYIWYSNCGIVWLCRINERWKIKYIFMTF